MTVESDGFSSPESGGSAARLSRRSDDTHRHTRTASREIEFKAPASVFIRFIRFDSIRFIRLIHSIHSIDDSFDGAPAGYCTGTNKSISSFCSSMMPSLRGDAVID